MNYMICENCENEFDTEESDEIICPYCGMDYDEDAETMYDAYEYLPEEFEE